MSNIVENGLPVIEPDDRLASLKLLLEQPSRRPRRSLATRLGSANRALSSLRFSERAERQMLQATQERMRQYMATANAGAHVAPTVAYAELKLEIETHLSNVRVIEQQIALVRMAIEHLSRRTKGWGYRAGGHLDRRPASNDGSKVLKAGIAAVRALRSLRAGISAASANI